MKRLILLRHANAEARAASGEDFDRALSERGRRDAAAIGRTLAAAGLVPSLALVSAAQRTKETWTLASPFLPDARIEHRRCLYNADAAALFNAADAEIHAHTVIVVAHNPGVGALAYDLCVRATLAPAEIALTLSRGFPTSAAAAFEFAPDRLACLGLFLPPHADCEEA